MKFIIYAICFIVGFLIAFLFLKQKKSNIKSYNISNEQLNKWVSEFYKTKNYEDFSEFVSDWLNGNIQPQEMKEDGLSEIIEDCKGNKCSCFPTREDCCECLGKDNKCHRIFNLNVVCGIHDSVRNICKQSDLLTDDEIKTLTDVLVNLRTN